MEIGIVGSRVETKLGVIVGNLVGIVLGALVVNLDVGLNDGTAVVTVFPHAL